MLNLMKYKEKRKERRMKPTNIKILGVNYTIEYEDKPSEVDIFKRESLWGQIDYWTRSIRVYDNGRSLEDIWHTIIHEVLHGIIEELHLKTYKTKSNDYDDQAHRDLHRLSLALRDVLFSNDILVE